MRLRGPWWLGAIVGFAVLAVGMAFGRLPLEGAGGLILVVSGIRAVLPGR